MKEQMKILIAYDGSDCAEAALDDLQLAGLPKTAEACVMSVTEIWLPGPPPSSFEITDPAVAAYVPAGRAGLYTDDSPAAQAAQAVADRAAARLRANFPGWTITTQIAAGSPKRELLRQANAWKPDLIVVGSHGHSTLGRILLGSVSQGVLNEARCSVRIARGRVEEVNTPVRVLAGVDGSEASAEAVREIASRHWPPMSEVRVIAVTDPLTPTVLGSLIPPLGRIVDESNAEDREWLDKLLRGSREEFKDSDLKVSTEIAEGDPRRVLVQTAESWGADCVFVGSVGFNNRFERFVLGSVSASVAARAHCSVEVVRQTKTDEGKGEYE
jgi:nucleotide-binding universal stress UspA family protein